MGDYNVFTDGLEIHTTIDKDAQEYVYKMLNSDEIINYPSKDLQAGVTLLDTKLVKLKQWAAAGTRRLNAAGIMQRMPSVHLVRPLSRFWIMVLPLNI